MIRPVAPKGVSRRAFLGASAGVIASHLFPSEASAADAGTADFTFAVLNDIHYRDERCATWLEQVLKSIRGLRPRPGFVLLNGDLSDVGTSEQLGAMRELFGTLPMPVHSTIGNHDYTEDNRREHYERLFGKHRNFRFRHSDWEFVGLDTTHGGAVFRTWVPGETLGWLDANLPHISKDRPLIVFSHFPLGRNWLRPMNAGDVIHRLRGHNVQGIFCGHWHGWTEVKSEALPVSTGRCCSWWRGNHDGSPLKGYFLCQIRGEVVSHEFIPVPIPGTLLQRA
jgi:predicted MPP superfamily phosphohydrolase